MKDDQSVMKGDQSVTKTPSPAAKSPFCVVIPARFASTRLPGKPLLKIAGRPMIEHVWSSARASGASRVVIATDDARIERTALDFGAEVVMTQVDHPNGTSRLSEVVEKLDLADGHVLVNVQGDEPLLPSAMIDRVASAIARDESVSIATLAEPITSMDILDRPSVVKVVCDSRQRALYFSRAPIPWDRDGRQSGELGSGWLRHIGIYAYRAAFLKRYQTLATAPIEALEQLEQLRALYHGFHISVAVTSDPYPAGVDTPEDLERVRQLMETTV